MRTVSLQIRSVDLAGRMTAMRTWLDDHGFRPASFRCKDLGNGEIGVRLDFENREHAEAFAGSFNPENHLAELLPSGTRAGSPRSAETSAAFDQPLAFGEGSRPIGEPEVAILVVDDEPDIREVVSNALSHEGFKIIEAGSGSDALYRLQSNMKINLLFTDIVMPGDVDGFELVRRAREFRPDLPVIYTTGYIKDLLAGQGTAAHGAMLRKPFASQKLVAEVRRALA
jgi:CheY-like chemotaxis protein